MAIIAPEGGSEHESRVKRKSNNARKLRAAARKKASKVASGAPEVMAKVTGFSRGSSHAKANIDYISRNGDLPLENERGEIIEGRKEQKAFAKQWVSDFDDSKRRKQQRDTMHLIMSMPEGTDPEAVRRATRKFAKETFSGNYEYVFALHTDTKSPHTHITIKTLGFNGRRLNPRKADLQRYREVFANAMEDEGFVANATPRSVRGVVKKAVRQVVLHAGERGKSTIKAKQLKEAVDDLTNESKGLPVRPEPWKEKISQTRERVRKGWESVAKLLSSEEARGNNDERRTGRLGYSDRGRSGSSDARIFAERVRSGAGFNPFAGIQTPGTGNATRGSAASALASVRKLPSVPMVQYQSSVIQSRAPVLLQGNAPGHMGHRNGRTTDNDLRRSGAGADRLDAGPGESAETRSGEAREGKQKGLDRVQATKLSDKELAHMIEKVIDAMPPIETASDALKAELRARFVKPVREQATRTVSVDKSDQVQTTGKPDRDIDR